MQSSFIVTFKLKCQNIGSSSPYIVGTHPSLGSGKISEGVPLTLVNGDYNYEAQVQFDRPITESFTYNYVIKTQFGTVVSESAPARILPKFTNSGTIYDVLNSANSLTGVLIKFRVRIFTHYGQEIFLTGNTPELGEWQDDSIIPLFFENNQDYWSTQILFPFSSQQRTIKYRYLVCSGGRIERKEPEECHEFILDPTTSPCAIEIADQYRWNDPVLDAFTRAAFTQVINRREHPVLPKPIDPTAVKPNAIMTYIKVYCPYVRSNQRVVLVGSIPELGKWSPKDGIVMDDGDFPYWSCNVELSHKSFPFEYKFVIQKEDGDYIWEQSDNRICVPPSFKQFDNSFPITFFLNNWFICPNRDLFKGLGIYVPLFSLRTNESQGIGSYTDIKKLVDCCNKMGASLIQLLPINDTVDQGTWADSYPYRQVSCFALHPIYIDLLAIKEDLPSNILNVIHQKKVEFEKYSSIQYPEVFAFKMDILKKIFALVKSDFSKSKELDDFISKNGSWLKPYALFCAFKEKYGTMEFRKWPQHSTITPQEIESLSDQMKDQLLFTYWIQFIAEKQFRESFNYASSHKVALKGDLPIGVNINSVECWTFPKLFRHHMCTGAPPDSFSSDGQNWKFPTYDWDAMEKDGFAWWKSRFQRMSELYHALRVDHILGFFRIWEIPRDSCIRGLLGHFFPAIPLTRQELVDMGLWDIDRYVKPYVRDHLLKKKFGSKSEEIAAKFFVPRMINQEDDYFDFKDDFDNEVKIHEALAKDKTLTEEERASMERSLFELLSNVLLIPDGERQECYHVRTEITKEHVEIKDGNPIVHENPSLVELDPSTKKKFEDLYNDFTYRRQTDLWVTKARPKLDVLKNSTKMLICGEDLGQITEGIIKCLEETGILSLRIQRMSKSNESSFDDFNKFKYLSVACPSTHDTSSLRGWWEEKRRDVSKFWTEVLATHDQCPAQLSTNIQEIILRQNLWSNSMWAIFLLQDLTGICESLRRQTPKEERINDPSNPDQEWKYRYPFTLEELMNHNEFNAKIRGLVDASRRI